MAAYKIELLTRYSDEAKKRFPPLEELLTVLKQYAKNGHGIIVKHDSLYDYQYDTKLSNYHVVDSKGIVGHILMPILENDKIYLIVALNNPEDLLGKNIICYYRATMETDPVKKDALLHYSNLFVIDLIIIQDNEYYEGLPISQFEECEDEWRRIFEQMQYDEIEDNSNE